MAWDSGARSVALLNSDGWYSATLKNPVGVMGGLNDSDTGASYIDIKFGFRALNGVIDAVSTGNRLGTNAFAYSGQLEVFVGRMLGTLFVSYRPLGATATRVLRNGMPVPGSQIIYQTDITGTGMPTGLIQSLLTTPQFFDASLYAPGDAIYNLAVSEPSGAYGTGGATMEALSASGTAGGANTARFPPMRAAGSAGEVYAGAAVMRPPGAFGLGRSVAIFPLMTATGDGGVNVLAGGTAVSAPLEAVGLAQGTTGGRAVFGYPKASGLVDDTVVTVTYGYARFPAVTARGQGTHGLNGGSAVFAPPGAAGAETLQMYSFGWVRSAPLTAAGLAANHETRGVTINVALAGFSGAEPVDRFWESTAAVSASAEYTGSALATDTIVAPRDEAVASSVTHRDTDGLATAIDRQFLGGRYDLVESATATDFTDHTWSDNPTAVAVASDEAVTTSTPAAAVDTALAQGEAVLGGVLEDVTDTATVTGTAATGETADVTQDTTLSGGVVQFGGEDVTDRATVAGEGSTASYAVTDVDDVGLADAVIAGVTATVNAVSGEVARLIDEALAAVREPTAWVLNSDTSATYWYSNWPFSHMAQTPDGTFAVGPDGLYRIGGTTDDGAPIPAQVEYDYNEFGGHNEDGDPRPLPEVKRVDTLYLGMESGAPLALKVKVWGDPNVYTYNTARTSTVGPRSDRFKPGLGLKGRYFKLALENTGGGSFAVNDMAADVAHNKRRL